MLKAKVQSTHATVDGDEFLLLAVAVRAAIGVDFLSIGFAEPIDVGTNGHIWRYIARRRYGITAQRTDGHLDVFFVGRGARVVLVAEVIGAEYGTTGITFHGQKV